MTQTMNDKLTSGYGIDKVIDNTASTRVKGRNESGTGDRVVDNRFRPQRTDNGIAWTGKGFPVRVPEAVIDWLYKYEQRFYRWLGEFFT